MTELLDCSGVSCVELVMMLCHWQVLSNQQLLEQQLVTVQC